MKKAILLLAIAGASFNLSAQQTAQFDPQSLEATLEMNSTAVVHTVLHNYGTDTLHFVFPAFNNRGTGGPDDFGYTWIDSDEEGGPNWEWNDISETGILVEGLMDDNVVGPFYLGFGFPFYGEVKGHFWINSNGAVSFNDQLISFSNYPIPTNGSCTNFIAWFWDDLTIDTAITKVYYQIYDEKTIVQFTKMVHYPGTESFITAQVIMVINGNIFIRYRQVSEGFDTQSATVGLQSADPAIGLQVVYNGPYVHSELALKFAYPTNFITEVSPSSGWIPPGTQETILITYSSEGFQPGTYEEELKCITNFPACPELYVHNVMHVTNPNQAGFEGTVTSAATGLPINDVKVVAGEQYVYTNAEGHYELPLEQGVYNVKFIREGYQTLIVEDTTALPGFSALDVELQGFYFLVGRVYAGDNPIETGFAYGYKMIEGTVVDIYAEMVGVEGYYEFSGLAAAQYIVKAEPSPNSMYYGDYLPTYYGDVIHWEEATIINLTQNTDGANIHLVPVSNAPQGAGSVSGLIMSNSDNPPAANIPIILRVSESGNPMITYSGTNGGFNFNSLQYGTYEIFAEIPGKKINPMTITLDESHPDIQDIEMMILEDRIIFTMGIEESDVFESASALYPNPANDKINILLSVKKPVMLNIQLTDILGKTIQSTDYIIDGSQNIELDLKNISNGIYMIRCEAGDEVITKKFIRK